MNEKNKTVNNKMSNLAFKWKGVILNISYKDKQKFVVTQKQNRII